MYFQVVLFFSHEIGHFFGTVCYEGKKEMFYLTTHSIHFIYDYMSSDIW